MLRIVHVQHPNCWINGVADWRVRWYHSVVKRRILNIVLAMIVCVCDSVFETIDKVTDGLLHGNLVHTAQ